MWLRSAAFVKVSHCRVPSKSLSLFSPPSLPLLPLVRGGRHFWPLCVAQIDQARPHSLGRSVAVGRWVTRSGDGRTTDCALFLRCRPGCGVKNDSDRQTQRMR